MNALFMKTKSPFSVGNCHVSPFENKLNHADNECILQPKFIELLCFLTECYPHAVTREELIDNVWDGNQFVGEKALTNAIWHLRKAFKELDPSNTYIETLRKTGYRLAQPPRFTTADESAQKNNNTPKTKYLYPFILSVLLIIIICGSYLYSLKMPPTSKQHVADIRLYEHIETITTSPGRELFPAISNDNHFLVYSWRRPGFKANLYLRDLYMPEQAAVALTDTPFIEGRAVFSHDREQLFYYQRGAGSSCKIIKYTLANAKKVTLGECGNRLSTDLDINATDSQLVFISGNKNSQVNQTQLNLVDLHSSPHAITQVPCPNNCQFYDESVVYSPDGKQLVVSRNLPSGFEELFLVDINTGSAQQLTSGFVEIKGVDWHPKKDLLVFSGIKKGKRQGYFYNFTTKTLTNAHVDGLSYPEYAQDGSLYFHQWNTDSALMRVATNNAVASSPFPILSTHFNTRFPDYNERSGKLAFVSNESGSKELWVANKDGTARKQLTQLKTNIYSPIWSPSGRYIAFVVAKRGEHAFYVYDFNSQTSTALTTNFSSHGKPSWSHDSTNVLVSDGEHVFRFDLKGNNLGQVIKQSTLYAYEDKQGALIFANPDAKQLWIKPPGSEHAQLLVASINLSNHTSWYYQEGETQALSRVYYFNVAQGDYRLSYYDFASASHHDIIRLPERSFSRTSGLTYIATAGWLIYTSYKSPQIDIKRIDAKYLP